MSFAEFLKKREFPKAGIGDAVIDPTDATPRVAKSFDAQFKPDPLKVYLTGWPALTLDDFLRWSDCIALLSNQPRKHPTNCCHAKPKMADRAWPWRNGR